jgi:transcriptional regulator NrdR family protein
MKCPICGVWTFVKESRESPTFGFRRRRECANEHKFTTQELVVTEQALYEERKSHVLKANAKSREMRNGRKNAKI